MRILIADDRPVFREAVATEVHRFFPDAFIDQAVSLSDAWNLACYAASDFGLFLIAFHILGMPADTLSKLVHQFPRVPIAVLFGVAQNSEMRIALRHGARGVIPRTATGDYIIQVVKLLLAGGTSVPAEILLESDEQDAQRDAANGNGATRWRSSLSQREQRILKGVAKGHSNKEIGRELHLAEVTVKLYLRGVFRKIGAKNRVDAAVIATKTGLF